MFAVSVVTSVGNGQKTLFWTDHWLHGYSIENLAPNVFKCIPPRLRKSRTVNEALNGLTWVSDIRRALGWQGLVDFGTLGCAP